MKKLLIPILIISAIVGIGYSIRHVSGVAPETVEKEVIPEIGFDEEENNSIEDNTFDESTL